MIALIAAVARNGVIGKDGKIPWHLPEDLKRFKQLTMGHVLVMGRKTYESIGKPLPGRRTIVLSRQDPTGANQQERAKRRESDEPWIRWIRDLGGALAVASAIRIVTRGPFMPAPDVFICGGAEVYREALERDLVDKMYLTVIDADYEGDTRFPHWDDGYIDERYIDIAGTVGESSESPRFWFAEYARRAVRP